MNQVDDPPPDAPVRYAWRLDERRIEVDVVVDAEDAVAALFPACRVEPERGAPDATLAAAGPDAFRVRVGGATPRTVASLRDALILLELGVAKGLLHGGPWRPVHMAGVQCGDQATLLLGGSGFGKSTLTVVLARAGHPILGDDTVRLDMHPRVGTVAPFPRLLKISDETRRRLGLPRPGGPLDTVWPESAFYRPRDLGSTWAPRLPPGRILLLDRRPDAPSPPTIAPVPPTEVLEALVRAALTSPDAALFDALADAVDRSEVGRLVYQEAEEVPPLL